MTLAAEDAWIIREAIDAHARTLMAEHEERHDAVQQELRRARAGGENPDSDALSSNEHVGRSLVARDGPGLPDRTSSGVDSGSRGAQACADAEDIHGYTMRRARVDAFVELVLGNVRVSPEVTLKVTALLRSDSNPTAAPSDGAFADVEIPYIGRVPGTAIARLTQIAGAAFDVDIRRADAGVTAWTSAATYRPLAKQRRFVVARDEHCRFPNCMRPARYCDVDHVIAHSDGGATEPSNLQLLCRRHHRLTTHGAWAVVITPDATCVWQSPLGVWYATDPGDAIARNITAQEGRTLVA